MFKYFKYEQRYSGKKWKAVVEMTGSAQSRTLELYGATVKQIIKNDLKNLQFVGV